MQTTVTLQAQTRDIVGKQVRALRRTGVVPAVLYGHGLASRNLVVNAADFAKTYKQAGESTLVDLAIEGGEPVKVLIHDIDRDRLTLKPVHVDFYQVKMTEKLTTEIPFKFIGDAPAVKELGGILVKNLDKVEVECLPQDLVHEIEVDLSKLATFEDAILIKDIIAPSGIALLAKPDEMVAVVKPPRSEEELAALTSTVEEKVEDVKVLTEEEKAKREAAKGAKEEKE
ncbi:MAG: 50S ribosomal protein L25 [Parcubacteria group bacterium GW2011_GWC2_45_7]|nr:MAG: 50S ribosomal protein L25 [Parcubacteria group bacterium GW2011_GWC2_45_7]KKU73710.1 MAG: 50S ribosomal protein L25 [Parcubacteria group bacterium GW2011_GWA2_47_26]